MTSSAIQAGKAFMELGLKPDFSKGFRMAERKLKAFGNKMRNIGASIFGGALAVGLPFASAIKSASDFEESLNRFKAVFKDNATAAREFADTYWDAGGRSVKQLLDSMATFQSFFDGMGKGADEAAKLSEALTKASVDFASFNNLSEKEGTPPLRNRHLGRSSQDGRHHLKFH